MPNYYMHAIKLPTVNKITGPQNPPSYHRPSVYYAQIHLYTKRTAQTYVPGFST